MKVSMSKILLIKVKQAGLKTVIYQCQISQALKKVLHSDLQAMTFMSKYFKLHYFIMIST